MLVINRTEAIELLDLDLLIELLADGFKAVSSGDASVPPRVAAFAPAGYLGAMPAYVDGVLEAKVVTVFPDNHARGLASHQAVIALFDAETGEVLAVMDGEYITAMRTAGASTIATTLLAREDAETLAIIGAGVQGRSHLEMVPRVRDFNEVRVASRKREHAAALAEEKNVVVVDDFEAAVRGADVVCLCTHASAPVIDRNWLSPGTHVTSVGANPRGGELDPASVRAGLVAVEDRIATQPPPSGAYELQDLGPHDVVELGELLNGTHRGRSSNDEITVYKSMGHAMEDAVAAQLVYDAAVRTGAGVEISL